MSEQQDKPSGSKWEDIATETEQQEAFSDQEGGPAGLPHPDEMQALSDKIMDLEQQLAEAKEKSLRAAAEMENVRRRARLDVEGAHKYALEKFAKELLGVVDSLDRAAEIEVNDEKAVSALHEGIELTLKLFHTTLDKFGIKVVDPVGQPFDPALHEAISMQIQTDSEPNTVLNVVQKGYLLNERPLRSAMVVVSKEN